MLAANLVLTFELELGLLKSKEAVEVKVKTHIVEAVVATCRSCLFLPTTPMISGRTTSIPHVSLK